MRCSGANTGSRSWFRNSWRKAFVAETEAPLISTTLPANAGGRLSIAPEPGATTRGLSGGPVDRAGWRRGARAPRRRVIPPRAGGFQNAIRCYSEWTYQILTIWPDLLWASSASLYA